MRARRSAGTTTVSTGWRPGGSSSSTDTSRSPKSVRASERGIGVALITNRSGSSPLPSMRRRCPTPKRCCSSITSSPRRANSSDSWNSAWVPTATAICPRASARRSAGAALVPVKRAVTTRSPSSRRRVSKCCSASSSVGARSAACRPLSTARSTRIAATRVLPLPTSPCSSRRIGRGRRRSSTISFRTRFCAPVSRKGSSSRVRSRTPSSTR